MKKLLLIDDDPQICECICQVATKLGLEVTVPGQFSEGFKLLDSSQFNLVIVAAQPLAKMSFPGTWVKDDEGGIDGRSFLPIFLNPILKANQNTKFIIIARGGFPAEARFALKKGAIDYIQIPLQRTDDGSLAIDFKRFEERLVGCIQRASAIVDKSRFEELDLDGIIGTSAQIRNALSFLADAAGNNFNVYIKGEIGTGKKLFARKIHENSNRKDLDFIVVDCSSFQNPETNFKDLNDLFLANNPKYPSIGTIVFHEVSYLPMSLQGNLLELIQKNWEQRVESGTGPVYRIISTSRKDLDNLLANNQFRDDLYYELNTIEFDLPPLRERREDIPQIAAFIIANLRVESQGDESIGMSEDFISALKGYSWPGNIKELKSALNIAITNSAGMQVLSPSLLPHKVLSGSTTALFNDSFQMDDKTLEDVFHEVNQPGEQLTRDDIFRETGDMTTTGGAQTKENLQICFRQSGNYWEVGNPEKPVPLAIIKGYGFIHFLLQQPNQFFSPVEVYHMRATALGTDSAEKILQGLTKSGSQDLTYEKLDNKTRTAIEEVIEDFEEQLSSAVYQDPDEAIEIKEKISEYKRLLNRKVERDPRSSHERSRTNVTRAITRALDEISKQVPDLKSYLNSSTIKTGDKMGYHPIVGNEPTWVLFDE
jgi:two-component system NtrC family response regulator